MASSKHLEHQPGSDSLLRLLGQHYGDRSVYLNSPRDEELLRDAVHRGLVSPSGLLTSTGYAYWRQHG